MKILFLAKYPKGEELRDGMPQRIKAIDTEFKNIKRTYLNIYYKGEYTESIINNITVINANIIKNPLRVYRILKNAKFVYIHSILNALFSVILLNKKQKIALDVHGVVPEEFKFSKRLFKCWLYSCVERLLFKKIDYAITVTKNMAKYYKNKYPNATKIKYITKSIYPTNTIKEPSINDCLRIKTKYNIKDSDIIIIYSGNTQKWQNIDLMIECMKKMNNKSYLFFIMTQSPDIIKGKVLGLLIEGYRIIIESVAPNELPAYYSLAHYGFMLRDDIVVNRVAAPTKMIEYLGYGIIPIVKSPNIGDWIELGYKYVSYKSDLNNLLPQKIHKNVEIAKKTIDNSQSKRILNLLFNNDKEP